MNEPELVVHITEEAGEPGFGNAAMDVSPGRAVLPNGTEVEVVDGTPTLEDLEAQGRITITRRTK